jgi:uncharacterized small protein (DUF1192 family)
MLGTIIFCAADVASEPNMVVDAPTASQPTTTDGSTVPTNTSSFQPSLTNNQDFNRDLQSLEDRLRGNTATSHDNDHLKELFERQATSCSNNLEELIKAMQKLEGRATLNEEDKHDVLKAIDHVQAHTNCNDSAAESLEANEIIKLVQEQLSQMLNSDNLNEAMVEFRSFLITQIDLINDSNDATRLRNLRNTLINVLHNSINLGSNIRRYHIRRIQVTFFRLVLNYRRQRIENRKRLKVFIEHFITFFKKKIASSRTNQSLDLSLIVEISKFITLCMENRLVARVTQFQQILVQLFASVTIESFSGLSEMTYYGKLTDHFNHRGYGALASLLLSHKHSVITQITKTLFTNITIFEQTINALSDTTLLEVTQIITNFEQEIAAMQTELTRIEAELTEEEARAQWLVFVQQNFADYSAHHATLVKWLYGMSIDLGKRTGHYSRNLAYLYAMAQYTYDFGDPVDSFRFRAYNDNNKWVTLLKKGGCNKNRDENAETYMAKSFAIHFKSTEETKAMFDKFLAKAKELYDRVFANCCTCPVQEA